MKWISSYLNDFFSLFFPDLCRACGKNLFKNENVICTDCIYHLPYTDFHLDEENKVTKQLFGRFPFESAAAFLYFKKGSRVQNLMHQLKYNHKPEVGLRIGEMYGYQLKKLEKYQRADLIIPVPLHASRMRKRGYNQSEHFGRGLSLQLGIECRSDILYRLVATSTQTRRSRFARYENMQEVFGVKHPELLTGKRVILVDDVITTGATIEACALTLQSMANVKISVLSIAFAD